MSAVSIAMVVVMVLGALYVFGYIDIGGVRGIYRRLRLAGMLWAVAILVIAATRIFDFP